MDVFVTLFTAIFPLYILIAIGYLAARFFNIDRLSLANLAVYVCIPIVMFGFIAQMDFKPSYFALPIVNYAIGIIVGMTFLNLGRKVYGDGRANILSLTSAQHNAGAFGLPVLLFVFDTQIVAIYMMTILGSVLYESTFGYYTAARGAFNVKDSFKKLATFPALYAMFAGADFQFCKY